MAHASQPAAAKAGPPYGTQASCRQCRWRTSHGRNPDLFIYLCTYPKVPTPFRTHTQPHPTQAAPDTALTQHTPGRPTLAVTQLGTTGAARGGMATNSEGTPPSCSTWGNVSMIFKSRLPHMLILLPPPSCRPSSHQSCMEGSLLLGHTPLNPTQAQPPVASTNTRQKRSLKMDTLMKQVY